MEKVLLIQPDIGFWDFMRTKASLPLSLLHVASELITDFEVFIVDQRNCKNWKQSILEVLKTKPILAGITTFTGPGIIEALKIAKFIKERSNIPIVWGGVHVSLLPEQSLGNKYVDFVIQGEGEIALHKLAYAISNKGKLDNIEGVWLKVGDEIKGSPPKNFLDLNTLNEIPYKLVNIKEYLPLYAGEKTLSMETSRGCPFPCTYCYNNLFNKSIWRAQSAEKVIERVKFVVKEFAPNCIYFVDDNFFVDLQRGREVSEKLKEINVNWQVQGVDFKTLMSMDDDYINLLQKSGCKRLTLGIETGSLKIRKLMKKPGDIEEIIYLIKRLKKFDIIIYCSFISNMPYETIEDLKKTIELIFRLIRENKNFRNSPIYSYIPFPGTQMFELAKREGFDPPTSLERWADYSYEKNPFKRKNGKNIKFYERLYFVSLFLDNKFKEYTLPTYMRILTSFYRPIAKFRISYFFFFFMPEYFLFNISLKIIKNLKKYFRNFS